MLRPDLFTGVTAPALLAAQRSIPRFPGAPADWASFARQFESNIVSISLLVFSAIFEDIFSSPPGATTDLSTGIFPSPLPVARLRAGQSSNYKDASAKRH
mmetsp:Transcript_66428/g.210244  ORF Transcript_66428/g.210244 Transcript_66428/m.210244 type:complete len:100 (-) Transcript_66428:877-1176(-)